MRPGDVVDGLRILRLGTTRDGVQQLLVKEGDRSAELLWMPAGEGNARFRQAHGSLVGLVIDGLVAPSRLVERADGVGVLRGWTDEPTLERLPGRLDVPVAASIAAAVLPAVLGAPALEELRLDDLRADDAGRAVLAPRFGRPPRLGDGTAARDLAKLLHRWWTGRSPPPDLQPVPTLDDPSLDPRCDACVAALWSADPGSAVEPLRALAPGDVDLRPLLRAHPSSLPVAVTRQTTPSEEGSAGPPWRALGWVVGLGSWGASLVALLTVVLAPLALLGFLLGAAAITAGEVLGRRALGSTPPRRLADRTVGGQLTPAWDAVEHLRELLGAAELAQAPEADVRALISAWEEELWAVASAHAAGGPVADGVAALRIDVVERSRRLASLVARLAEDDEAAGSELARWVRADAP
jgi:hypothetical protein